jgi:soluble lytic murein transglycosylase-like protein
MKHRFPLPMVTMLAATAVFFSRPISLHGETPIQAFVAADGRIVYTNAFEPAPPPETAKPKGQASSAPSSSQAARESILALTHSISTTHGIDPQLVTAVMRVESNFDRWARSSKGALGLMQLIPATGRRFGVQDFFDPRQNIEGGVRYLKFLLEKFDGNVDLTLAAYNAGENLVARLGRIPAITETRNYVRKIRAIYPAAKSPVNAGTLVAEKQPQIASPETNVIFREVDERGTVRFSNIAPAN